MRSSKQGPPCTRPCRCPCRAGSPRGSSARWPPVSRAKIILRPGQTVMAGARPAGLAATAAAFAARSRDRIGVSEHARRVPDGLAVDADPRRPAWSHPGYVSVPGIGVGVGVGVDTTGVAVGPPGRRHGASPSAAAAVTTGIRPFGVQLEGLERAAPDRPAREVAIGILVAGNDRADHARVSPSPPAKAGTAGAAKKLALRLKFRMRLEGRSRASPGRTPGRACRRCCRRCSCRVEEESRVRAHADDVHRNSVGRECSDRRVCATARAPAGQLRAAQIETEAGRPPGHGSEEHSSWPSVTNTMM